MTELYGIIGYPLGWIMWLCYKIIPVYLIALVLFTIVTKLALLPLSIKQQKSTAKMAAMRPRIDDIQKKYANNKEKLNEEIMKLYKEENFNPASGCLPILIQMPILFGLIDVIYKPLTHILRIPTDVIKSAQLVAEGLLNTNLRWMDAQISIMHQANLHPEAFANEVQMFPEFLERINSVNLTFLGASLGDRPTLALPLILVPVLSGLSSILLSVITTRNSGNKMNGQAASMMLMMPIFSVVISFQVPAGVGIYWVISNVFMIGQAIVLNRLYNPAKMIEQAKLDLEERRKNERTERLEARAAAREGDEEAREKGMNQKQINRQKLIEARKRDALKYGEEYVDDGGDDNEG